MSEAGIPISAVDRLILPRSLRDEIMIHLITSAPHEGVGLLAVHDPEQTDDGLVTVGARFFAGTNVERSATRFTMDPEEVMRALRDMREDGLRHGAIVHSHLGGPATPSATDVREAYYPDVLTMIVSLADQPASTGVWRMVPEQDLVVVQSVEFEIWDGI